MLPDTTVVRLVMLVDNAESAVDRAYCSDNNEAVLSLTAVASVRRAVASARSPASRFELSSCLANAISEVRFVASS